MKNPQPTGKNSRRSASKLVLQTKATLHSRREEWIELFAYGISVSTIEGRPLLILKDEAEKDALPVWLSPLSAGLALSDLSMAGSDSHSVVRQIFADLGVRVTRCQIAEIVGHHQYAQIFFEGRAALEPLRVRADEAMSFCLAFKARFFSTRSFMMRCRDVDAEMAKLEQGLLANPEIGSKTHPYVM